MERTIKKVEFPQLPRFNVTRVAAYARVSSGKEEMLHSLSAQVSYYSDLIQRHPGWYYCGVYVDKALTGTKEEREGFLRLLKACRSGQVDMVITKSISRFARNTVTLLSSIRELKKLGVDIFFEEQNIHSLSAEGELVLTIFGAFAQEESRSASDNQKWRIQKLFSEGKPWTIAMLGYRQKNGKYEVVPEEAEIVRRIYSEYLDGKGVEAIVKGLTADGVMTEKLHTWHKATVALILRNGTYTGNLLLQRFYRENHITKRKLANNGELPMYAVTDSHEAIIDSECFAAVQSEIAKRAEKYAPKAPQKAQYPYSGLIVCSKCGKHYRRKVTATGPVWICSTYNFKGKKACPSKQIPEPALDAVTADIDLSKLTCIQADDGNTLMLRYRDGATETRHWNDRSRAESWTPEMRAEAGKKTKERRARNA